MELIINAWAPRDAKTRRIENQDYLARCATSTSPSLHRLEQLEPFGAFAHVSRAELNIGAFGTPEEDSLSEQNSVVSRFDVAIRCLNAAPQLKALRL